MPLPATVENALQRLWEGSETDYRNQILGLVPRDSSLRLLDVGCHDGEWTQQLADAGGITRVSGIEIVDEARESATQRGFDVRAGDLESRWPFDAGSFDVVHANQVIEHVKRLDHFVGEVARVLAPGGLAIICTENLSSWHNVAAAAMGWMPFSLTNISALGPVGNPIALHNGENPSHGDSWQHLHVLTMDALVDVFAKQGFVTEHRFGSGYYPAFGRAGRWLSSRDVRHAHFIGITARAPG